MAKDEINVAKTFKEVAGLDHIDSFEISGSMTVAELENHFQQNYKIGVQIMRQSGNAWIMTTQTDGWTLRKSNETGREDSH